MMVSAMTLETAAVPDELQAALLERIDAGDIELPLLPDVVWQVTGMTTSDDADARKLADLIQRDQALASHVLRVANSPAYMPRTPIVSLQQAISRLGMKQLAEIAFSASVQARVFTVPGYQHEVRSLWEHALATAAYGREIARIKRHNVEAAFLCGLLHDIGEPIVLQLLVDLHKTFPEALEPAIIAAVMQAHHNRVGLLLATTWSLPPHVHESILYHHDYLMAPTCGEAVMVTRFADHLSCHLMRPDLFDETSVYHHPILTDLHLYPDEVETLLAKQERIRHIVEAMT